MWWWEARKITVAEIIASTHPHVIGLQEVRVDTLTKWNGGINQLKDLQKVMPTYKFSAFAPSTEVAEGRFEGLGILSRVPFVGAPRITELRPSKKSPDKNKRVVLSVTIDVDGNGPVEVVVAHLSYDKKQQCNNVVDIMNHLAASETVDINTSPGGAVEDPSTQTNKAGKGTFIVVGDLNVYNDDSAAVDLLQSAAGSEGNRCAVEAAELTPSWVGSKSKPAGKRKTFDDAWLLGGAKTDEEKKEEELSASAAVATAGGRTQQEQLYVLSEAERSYTFSNMPSPGLVSRPDRILVSSGGTWEVQSMELLGRGPSDFEGYIAEILWLRLKAMARNGECKWDCGPNAVCTCGVCVAKAAMEADGMCTPPCKQQCTHLWSRLFLHLLPIVTCIALALGSCVFTFFRVNRRNCLPKGKGGWLGLATAILFVHLASVARSAAMRQMDVEWQIGTQYIREELYPGDHLYLSATLMPRQHPD